MTYDGYSILAYILEPDEAKSAGSKTVDAFLLILANNHILQCGARFKQEDGIGIA